MFKNFNESYALIALTSLFFTMLCFLSELAPLGVFWALATIFFTWKTFMKEYKNV